MLSPLETGIIRGQLRGRGRSRETGTYRGCQALAGGPQCQEKPGNWPGLVQRDQIRSPPSHTWRGPCLILAGTSVPAAIAASARTNMLTAPPTRRIRSWTSRSSRPRLSRLTRRSQASAGGTLPESGRHGAAPGPVSYRRFISAPGSAGAITAGRFLPPSATAIAGTTAARAPAAKQADRGSRLTNRPVPAVPAELPRLGGRSGRGACRYTGRPCPSGSLAGHPTHEEDACRQRG
jgi:hypothetical protein